ncbi:MAG: hypothetical protein IJX74_04145 [Clostridia bacterium]|nr:hypothetical protein [Clostridia bacterium]
MFKNKRSARVGPHPLASRLLLIGQPLLLLALMDIAAQIYRAGAEGHLGVRLWLVERGEYVLASAVILYGGALFLNYLEKFYSKA